jgi:Pirin C-terminal cupin domain.
MRIPALILEDDTCVFESPVICGKPSAPIMQHELFVMNNLDEICHAIQDFQEGCLAYAA